MTLHEIVRKLIGPIMAVGDTTIDDARVVNMQAHMDLVDNLLQDLIDTSINYNRHEASMKHSGEKARDYLRETAEWLQEATDAVERAEREAWEAMAPCKKYGGNQYEPPRIPPDCRHPRGCSHCIFDACPLRLKNVPSQDGHETEEAK